MSNGKTGKMGETGHETIDVTVTPLERQLRRVVLHLVPLVPERVTPNQVTVVSGLMGVAGGLCYVLADHGRGWLLAAAAAILLHLVLDVLDGCIARARDKKSDLGYFLDQFLDLVAFVALMAGIGLSAFARFEIAILAALLYAINLTIILHSIQLCGKWVFPALGPSETLAILIGLTLVTWAVPGPVAAPFGLPLTCLDIAFMIGLSLGVVETTAMSLRLIATLARRR